MDEIHTTKLIVIFDHRREDQISSLFWEVSLVDKETSSEESPLGLKDALGKECKIKEQHFLPDSKTGVFKNDDQEGLVFIDNDTQKKYIVREVMEYNITIKKYKP
jgi:hypothetical protein